MEEIEINERLGVMIDFSDEKNAHSLVIWDNGDYILQMVGDLPKSNIVFLANSVKIAKE